MTDASFMESDKAVIERGVDPKAGETGCFGDREDGGTRGATAPEMTTSFSSTWVGKALYFSLNRR